MTLASLVLLAFAMSTDAFAASISRGASMVSTRPAQALRIGLIFGVIEGIAPVIGWSIGLAASRLVADWDHWIAFVLLGVLGGHMIWEGFRPAPEPHDDDSVGGPSFWLLVATAFATSIDAMAVGVTLAFANVNIAVAAAAIGIATTLMVTLGILLGRVIGNVIGRRAEIAGGIVLIAIGCAVLYDHLAR